MFLLRLKCHNYWTSCSWLTTGTHSADQKSQQILKVITKAVLEALRTFRFVSWFLKSTIQLPFLCDIWKSHTTDFGALFAHFQIYGYCNSLLKLCPLCTLLLVSYSLVLHVSMVMGAVLGHSAWTSAWRGSQEFMPNHHPPSRWLLSPAVAARLSLSLASGEMPHCHIPHTRAVTQSKCQITTTVYIWDTALT